MAINSAIVDCEKYLGSKNLMAAIRDNDEQLKRQIGVCLNIAFRVPFTKQVIYPFLLMPYETKDELIKESFKQAVSSFIEDAKQKNDIVANNIEKLLLTHFKHKYHQLLSVKLQCPDVTDQLCATLLQMNVYCKDYIIWHYIDNFTVRQVSIITGKPIDYTKKEIWNCRKSVKAHFDKCADYSTQEIITEQQFYELLDYFADEPIEGNVLINGDQDKADDIKIQRNFKLELLLRYNIDKSKLLKSMSSQTIEPFQSADSFIEDIRSKFDCT